MRLRAYGLTFDAPWWRYRLQRRVYRVGYERWAQRELWEIVKEDA